MSKYEELGCEVMNEADCEEALDEEGLDRNEEFEKHFEEK